MKINEEKLVDQVLMAIVGKDPHSEHGYIEFQSELAQRAIESLVYGLIREDKAMEEGSILDLCKALFYSIENRKDDCMEERNVSGEPEND